MCYIYNDNFLAIWVSENQKQRLIVVGGFKVRYSNCFGWNYLIVKKWRRSSEITDCIGFILLLFVFENMSRPGLKTKLDIYQNQFISVHLNLMNHFNSTINIDVKVINNHTTYTAN